jgi:hypothetical protein
VFVQDLRKPSIKVLDPDNPELPPHDQNSAPPHDVLMSKKEDDWRKTFIDFILDQLVPDDKAERERITRQSANYVMIGTDLYRKAASTGVLMKCILRSEGLQLLAFTAVSVATTRHPLTWSARHTDLDSTGPRP